MTENEAKQTLEIFDKERKGYMANMPSNPYFDRVRADNFTQSLNIAIKSLEEIQQYQAIGTVEEIKELLQIISEGQDDVDESGISTGLLNTLLEYTEYAKIGTVEECREARERQRAKKPVKDEYNHDCCPNCGWIVYQDEWDGRYLPHCENCGQAIDWSE